MSIAIWSAMLKALAHQSGQSNGDSTKLIAPMVARFMTTGRAFPKSRKSG
jgi:hypothetical protein